VNLFERQIVKAIWGKVLKNMPHLKRWLPLVGSALLVLVVVLRLLGQTALASAVEAIGSTIGITTQSPVSSAEVMAAVTALVGIILKIRAEIAKLRPAPASGATT
jgi:hypothetical protein